MSEACPTCGQKVRVSTADEGTSFFIGMEYEKGLEEAAKICDDYVVYWESVLGKTPETLAVDCRAKAIRSLKTNKTS